MIRTIRNRWTNAVIWEGEAETVKDALHAAFAARADLRGAVLRGAVLTDADLRGADLRGADLTDAVLRGAVIPPMANITGESWLVYLTEVVPALLIAGGKPIESFAPHFQCHTWENCPMAHAFDVRTLSGVPILLRPRAQQFVSLFDAGLIPWPLPTAEQVATTFELRSKELEAARQARRNADSASA